MATVSVIEVPRPPATTSSVVPVPIQVQQDMMIDNDGFAVVVWSFEGSPTTTAKKFESSAIVLGATGDEYIVNLSSTPTGGAALTHTVSYKQVAGDTLAKLIKRLVDEFNLFKDSEGSAVVFAKAIAGNKIEITGRDGHALTVTDGSSTTPLTFTDLTPSAPGTGAPNRGELARLKTRLVFNESTGIQQLEVSYQFLDAATPPAGQPGYLTARNQSFQSTMTIDQVMTARGIPRPTP